MEPTHKDDTKLKLWRGILYESCGSGMIFFRIRIRLRIFRVPDTDPTHII